MGRFYWLKLKKDFFKRHDLLNLRSMQNGLTYEAIFIHLMAEAIDHDGCLRYSEKKPYTARTLAPLATTDEKTMSEALEAFEDLELIEINEDGTIYVPLAIENLGSETEWAEKKRKYRDTSRTDEDNVLEMSSPKKTKSDKSIEYRDKSTEYRDKKEEIEDNKLSSLSSRAEREIPSKNEVVKYAHSHKIDRVIDVDQWYQFYQEQEWKIQGEDIKDWKSLLMKWASGIKEKKNIRYMENEYDFSEDGLQKRLDETQKRIDDLLQD